MLLGLSDMGTYSIPINPTSKSQRVKVNSIVGGLSLTGMHLWDSGTHMTYDIFPICNYAMPQVFTKPL